MREHRLLTFQQNAANRIRNETEERQVSSSMQPQADHPLLVEAVVDWNLSNDLLLFIEVIHEQYGGFNFFQMQNLKQFFQKSLKKMLTESSVMFFSPSVLF